MQPFVSRMGVLLFGLVLVAWMYFGFALDLQHRASTTARRAEQGARPGRSRQPWSPRGSAPRHSASSSRWPRRANPRPRS